MRKMKRTKIRGKGRPKGSFKLTDQQVSRAIEVHEGILTDVVIELGCSYGTLRNYIKRSETIEEVYKDAKRCHVSKLISRAKDGLEYYLKRKDFKAICFVLKTQGRDEGWSEKVEIIGKDSKDLFKEMSVEEIDREILKLEREINSLKG